MLSRRLFTCNSHCMSNVHLLGLQNARFTDPIPVVMLGCSFRAPQTSSKDVNPKRVVVDSICPSKNMPSSTGSFEASTGAPHRSFQDQNPTGVVDSVCPPKNISPTVRFLEEYIPESLPRDFAGERECWIAAGEECYNLYKAESGKVKMNADPLSERGINGRIPLQLDLQAVLAASPDVRKGSDQENFHASLKLVVDSWLEDVGSTELLEWPLEDCQTLNFLSGSCQANTESTAESGFQATDKYSLIPASAVEVQRLGQNDSPMSFKFYPATPQIEHDVHLDRILSTGQGVEAPVDMELYYPIHSQQNACPIVPSSQVLSDHVSVESRSVQPLPRVRDANFRVEGEKPMPVGLCISNHTITNRVICSGPAPIPVLTSDWTGNFIPRVPIAFQVYAVHLLCSHQAPPQPPLTNPKDTTDIPELKTEKSAESGRKPGNLSFHSDQLSPLSPREESLTTVPGSGADSNSVRGSEDLRTRSSKKRPHKETLPVVRHVVPDVYQEPLKPISGKKHQDPLVKEKIHICKSMLGLESIRNFDGLEESVYHILSVHQRCQKERRPFHIHRQCASKEDTTAADCCWLKQFERICPDDRRIKRSFQEMCTLVVNSAARNHHPTYRIIRFPDWVNEEFKEFLKLHPKGLGNSLKEIDEMKEFAESLGLEYSQVLDKMKHLRFNVAEDKRLQEREAKGESPSCAGKSDREDRNAISAQNLGPPPLLSRTASYRDRNVKRRTPSRSQLRNVGGRLEPTLNPK